MATSHVDQKHRIVIDKQTRTKTHFKPGDTVIIEPLDSHSFKVNILDFTSEKVEDDPAWKALHKPAKIKRYIPPEKIDEIIEEEMTECLNVAQNTPQPSKRPTKNTLENSKSAT
jgi:bifunctional DNA-binding transcriptional regulator/antitoxin component of YhaV-PrlF toxin-antitoxin module